MSQKQVRVYGPSINHDSWARVARGMCSGLEAIGRLAGFFALESAVANLDDGLEPGYDAELGVLIGPPAFANVLRGRGEHRRRAVMIAANSSWLPRETMRSLRKASTELLAPSEWSADVVRGYTDLPVSVWPHGVSGAFGPHPDSYLRSKGTGDPRFRVLHLASTIKERKGTEPLLRAWCRLFERGHFDSCAKPELVVVLSGPHSDLVRVVEQETDSFVVKDSIAFQGRCNYGEEEMAGLYQQFDLVCQPSRAEGFGLVPLEARACGVPVAMTTNTGHRDHWQSPGVVPISSGPMQEPIDDGPGAAAPSVHVEDVLGALADAYSYRGSLRRDAFAFAEKLRQLWSWETVCRTWVDQHLA